MRGLNWQRSDWGSIAICQLSSTFVPYHRDYSEKIVQMAGPGRQWTTDNPSEMNRCCFQHPRYCLILVCAKFQPYEDMVWQSNEILFNLDAFLCFLFFCCLFWTFEYWCKEHCIFYVKSVWLVNTRSRSSVVPTVYTLWWRHNEHDVVSNHQPHYCLLNCLFRRIWLYHHELPMTPHLNFRIY